MNRVKSGILAAGAIALASMAAACEQEPVLGYCDAGDTCRYDLPERMLVRTYNGYFEERHPGQQPVAVATAAPTPETTEPGASGVPARTTTATTAAPAAVITVSNLPGS